MSPLHAAAVCPTYHPNCFQAVHRLFHAADAPFRVETRQGFHVIFWRHGGIEYVAVSDVEEPQLATFAHLVAGGG